MTEKQKSHFLGYLFNYFSWRNYWIPY